MSDETQDRMRADFLRGATPELQTVLIEMGGRMARNLMEIILEDKASMSADAFAEYEHGLISFFRRLSPEFGAWALTCVERARERHGALQ
jgi:hypothetical protein